MINDEIYYENLFKCQAETIDKIKEENNKLNEEVQKLKKQYCERSDCSGRIGASKKVEQLQQENKQLKEDVGKFVNDINELQKELNKENLECSKYAIENQELKKQYCERTDCSGRIRASKKMEELQQRIDYLERSNDRRESTILELREEITKRDEKINKAIEYVSNKKAIINTDVIRIFDLFEINEQGYTNELLDILKGRGEEE